jgi:hypothetical protein
VAKRDHVSLIVKGPKKSATRAAARHGIPTASCRTVGGDVQCYAPCTPSTEAKVTKWYHTRSRVKAGRGHPPGTLLYYSGSCVRRDYKINDPRKTGSIGGARRRKRR